MFRAALLPWTPFVAAMAVCYQQQQQHVHMDAQQNAATVRAPMDKQSETSHHHGNAYAGQILLSHDYLRELEGGLGRKCALLGSGTFGQVHRTHELSTGKPVAVKLVSVSPAIRARLDQEIAILTQVERLGGHSNIVPFHGLAKLPNCKTTAQEDEDVRCGLVFEMCQRGELYTNLVEQGAFAEDKARTVVEQIASALSFLHGNGIVHGDVKPENILIRGEMGEFTVALCDFGSAVKLQPGGKFACKAGEPLGSVNYSAPELLQAMALCKGKGVIEGTCAVDIFALGVLLYIMLSGQFPFDLNGELKTEEEISKAILSVQLSFDAEQNPVWSKVSDEAKQLISKMMCASPADRITALQIITEDPWVLKKRQHETSAPVCHSQQQQHASLLLD